MIRTITGIVRIKRAKVILLIAFSQFILLRTVPWPKWLPVPAKYADADTYINANAIYLAR